MGIKSASQAAGSASNVVHITAIRRTIPDLHFNRGELNQLLALYSMRVSRGEWRDYAIITAPGAASFCIFRHSHETPLFVISKLETKGKHRAAIARQGRYIVRSAQRRLRQSDDLADVLSVFDGIFRLVSR